MDEPLLAFAQSVDVSSCRILGAPNLIFLCGGRVSEGSHSGPYSSARDYFNRYITANEPEITARVRLAEAISRWFDRESFSGDDTFSDLLEVEEYLADLSDTILILVESEGSIAELGAFTASDAVRPKVVAIINSTFDGPSFISDGPVRRLRFYDPSAVYSHAWDHSLERLNDQSNVEAFETLSRDVVAVLKMRETAAPNTRKLILDQRGHGHSMRVIADLVDIVGIATQRDIQRCLLALRPDLDQANLRKYFFLLSNLGIIGKETHSNQPYYFTREAGPFISYGFKPEATIKDRGRAKLLIRQGLDGARSSILTRYLRRNPPRGEVRDA